VRQRGEQLDRPVDHPEDAQQHDQREQGEQDVADGP
jgi:hypothetical protein